MRTVKEIAEGLCLEINEKFNAGAMTVAGMHYDLNKRGGESKRIGEVTQDYINSWQITHDKFNITVKPDRFYFSVASPEAENWAGKVEGLPGVLLKTQIDRNPESYEYLLADPTSIDSMMDRIERLLNEVSGNSVQTPESRQGDVGTFAISIGGIGGGAGRGEEEKDSGIRGSDQEGT